MEDRVWHRPRWGEHFSFETITIEVASWVRPETVDAVFREARRLSRGNQKNRPIGEKNLKLFRFVTERSNPIGKLEDGLPTGVEDMADLRYEKRPQGRELVQRWNQTEWVQEARDDRGYDLEKARVLLRDYRRARRSVAHTSRFRT